MLPVRDGKTRWEKSAGGVGYVRLGKVTQKERDIVSTDIKQHNRREKDKT